ncbi:MAG: aspartate--tRNA ligase [Saprospiraceae bacterium]|jgi:aspartyl-tRNA synthetase|nr:aspartate--tRNA ligase [Saprospiraceae bacterium]MDC3210763.1 aspartate--tRNA ligase [Saprospiraceae bacterium]MDG1435692.1 aspartate--tRNA ligase [Saprospiraceae bacterium]MDG2418027.1 aspartate--tRNA ligase [Saprospiraceae bacterium]
MYRTHNCGQLRIENVGSNVVLSGWVQGSNDLGHMMYTNLRDRYGITQLIFTKEKTTQDLFEKARTLGREYVVRATGKVIERHSKNARIPTGDIEIEVIELEILNESKTPPFTIDNDTDGGEDLRMKYRYLDLRRKPVQSNIIFRSKLSLETRKYMDSQDFVEVETPFLIKSTPEGARDFVVPSRMNKGQFYALPQSPQTFKQLLMISGLDRYFQIVKCFRDEDLRADRQPEFTQIDCEMSYVTQEDILNTFEGLTKHLFKTTLDVELSDFPRMTYDDAMRLYGSDKPDIRFGMEFVELNDVAKGKGFPVFDNADMVVGICAEGQAGNFSNKDIKKLTEWMQRPQIGAKGLVYVKMEEGGTFKSPVGKFFSDEVLKKWAEKFGAKEGDMMLILSGENEKTRKQLNELRLEMGSRMGLRDPKKFSPLWVVDFPLLEWDEDSERFHAMHHPFTSPKKADMERMLTGDHETMKSLRADAYDLVINGVEIGGGSIRIHDRDLQSKNFDLLGFTKEEAEEQFGFLLGAFEYGAPPHGGIAFGFDRLCAVLNGVNSIRDFIAFPKNNQGRDMMIDAPSSIDVAQLDELGIDIAKEEVR